ncbi:lantibiotic dehydratase [Amycolatopsis sp. NPDC059657]|uniref:lantibiotic dehydratase n=1 Tax=Amycolatopsis sp. NPDC059657 TaxID=3346899 RepID=UPI00366AB8D9
MTELYRPSGFFMLRAATLPAEQLSAIAEHGRPHLRELAALPRVEQALHVASPSLTRGLAKLTGVTDKKSAKAYSSLLRYLTRMATRPTPYGLFAGVGMGDFSATASATLGPGVVAATRTRADVGWLLELIKSVETDSALVDSLRVNVNPMLYHVGDRAVLPFADVHGQSDNRLVGFRRTAPVEVALRVAALPGTTYAELVEAIKAEIPRASHEQARGLVGQLWELHVLISDLRPSLTVALPEQDLVKRLDGIEACLSIQDELRRVREHAAEVDAALGGRAVAALDRMTAHQSGLTPGFAKETYQLDAALDLTETGLPVDIGASAADAASVLTRLSGFPHRHHHLVEYHSAFLEKYGLNAEIPILELLSPESGLDAPAGYLTPPRTYPLPSLPEETDRGRDAAYLALAAEALHQGKKELELTDEVLDRLAPAVREAPRPRPALDLHFQLAAASKAAIDRGEWRMVLTPTATTDGGRTFGRFFDLFDEKALTRLAGYAQAEEALLPEAVFVELNYVSPFGRGGNVTTHPALRRYEICVNTSPSLPRERQIDLTDIVVGATSERFFLRSKRLGKEIVVTQSHMLSLLGAPNVCRLLLELSQDGFAQLPSFNWGAVGVAPYLPRVTRGKVVLSPAQWRLSSKSLGDGPFDEAVREWRQRWGVPRHVYLVWMDNRLLLDLDRPLYTEELRAELRRADETGASLLLQELLPGFSELWLESGERAHHFSEVVVPLLAREPGLVRRHGIGAPPQLAEADRRKLVGSEWVYLKLYSATAQQDDVLAGHLPALVGALRADALIDRWFYIKYFDPYPHLRIRVRATGPVGDVLARCASWAQEVIASGLASDLAFVSYDRELERYGGPELIDLAEEVFTANSAVTVDLVNLLKRTDLDPDTLAVVALHKLASSWGVDVGSPGADIEPPDAVRKQFRRIQPTLCDLLAPWDEHPDPKAREQLGTLDAIFAKQHDELAHAGRRARELAAEGRLAGAEETVLGSLLHMQVNRLLGIDQEREKACHHLWALARRAIARRPVPKEGA